MKKIFICLSLAILTACSFLPTQAPPQLIYASTDTPLVLTPTPDFTGMVISDGAELYAGPGENYSKVGNVIDSVTILGQGFGCVWLKVFSRIKGLTGWLSADKITYTVSCEDVPEAPIPPLPQPTIALSLTPSLTLTLTPSATFAFTPTAKPTNTFLPVNTCKASSAMTIGNRTGAAATFTLVGPGTFMVTLQPDVNTSFPVCEGCYEVYLTGGGCPDLGSTSTSIGRICDGFNGWLRCP